MKPKEPESPAIIEARCLRVEQFAKLKGISKYTVRDWINRGLLPYIKIQKTILIPLQRAEEALALLSRGVEK